MAIVYLNGEFLPAEDAWISPDDRGFLFADGIYEVTPAYRGRLFRLERHLERMAAGLKALRMEVDLDGMEAVHRRLLAENGLEDEEVATIYLQVTRGAAPRTHAFPPPDTTPTIYAFAGSYERPARERWEEGFEAVTVPDRRWSRVDVKSIALLPNVLALQAAVDAGAADAILVRDGVALEGAHNNLCFVFDGTIATHPTSHEILHGVTREYILELARELGHPVQERAVQVEEIARADEIFFTGTTTEVRPCVQVDGRVVGDGSVGPVSRSLYEAFLEGMARFADGGAPAGGG